MCGIFFSCTADSSSHPYPPLDLLQRRGPDHAQSFSVQAVSQSLSFTSTVLSLRGEQLVPQPLRDCSGSVLCWNGEAWQVNDQLLSGNDAEIIFSRLIKATSHDARPPSRLSPVEAFHAQVLKELSAIAGPYAFVFYDAIHHQVYCGRDVLGRRSLLYREDASGSILISSVAIPDMDGWAEVEADGFYVIDLRTSHTSGCDKASEYRFLTRVRRIPWSNIDQTNSTLPIQVLNRTHPINASPGLSLNSVAVGDLEVQLRKSLAVRVLGIPVPPAGSENASRLAILFSGGLDCTLLARLIHDIIPLSQSVDLLNVAFENPRAVEGANARTKNSVCTPSEACALCPDRITGLASYTELRRVCPQRTWHFVSVDVTYKETLAHRAQIISLMHPHNTEMDLSIACALYFAARGAGTAEKHTSDLPETYKTPARVLLSGLGADELFGGYTRHATAFSRRGYHGLLDELELDITRLAKRNLGRDDRVISHWTREVRYPYLDETFVTWALLLPVWEKCSFGQPPCCQVEGDVKPELDPEKKLLRLLAWKLGIKGAATERKRAIQFGARTAKMESGKTKGSQPLS